MALADRKPIDAPLFTNLDAKRYEKIVFEYNEKREQLLQAFDIVKSFIQHHKLILTGGMAIDFALRLKGKQLYEDGTIPDYDFYSPKHFVHAYQLATQLCQALKDCEVTVINATHSTTMKVRVDYVVVADITYIPPIIFEQIPTLEYSNFLIEHPHFKYINMHLALCLPYNDPPRESSAHRWKKDMTRFDMLYGEYPIQPHIPSSPHAKFKLTEVTIPTRYLENNCLAGICALACYADNATYEKKALTVKVPKDSLITIMSIDAPAIIAQITADHKSAQTTSYNAILDQIDPSTIIITKAVRYEIINVKNKQYSATQPFEIHKDQAFAIVNPQAICTYLLTKHFLFNTPQDTRINPNANYFALYHELLQLIAQGKHEYVQPYYKVYGSESVSMAVLHAREMIHAARTGERSAVLIKPNHFRPNIDKDCEGDPRRQVFDYTKSWLFKVDGCAI